MCGLASAPLLLTPGEPAGVGPEIACRVAVESPGVVLVADQGLVRRSMERLGLDCKLTVVAEPGEAVPSAGLACWHVPLAELERVGEPSPTNAGYVLECLRLAARACLDGRGRALVTGPVHKGVINRAGMAFRGHTEFLAELADAEQVVMLLAAGHLRVALATTHLPLAAVPAALTAASLERTLVILDHDLKRLFALERPVIAVLGLNPHAGEGGYLGREEIDTIAPLLERLRAKGMNLVGPLPADTAFVPEHMAGFDAVLAMYHDQGLPVLKHAGFGRAVNVTLGLPFVRTSVDHGTALDRAGRGQASTASLAAALELAATLSRQRS